MQLTQNAPTYQTSAHWALCPHITDFLLRANGKTRSFVSTLSWAYKSFSDYWMHVGTPALLGYCISLYQNCCMHLVEHRYNRTKQKWLKRNRMKNKYRIKKHIKNIKFYHSLVLKVIFRPIRLNWSNQGGAGIQDWMYSNWKAFWQMCYNHVLPVGCSEALLSSAKMDNSILLS